MATPTPSTPRLSSTSTPQSTKQQPPSTPKLSTSTPTSTASTAPTGTWIHPRLSEIARRQNASTFNGTNISKIVNNLVFLFIIFILENLITTKIPSLAPALAPFAPWPSYVYTLLRVVLVGNILIALLPLLKKQDDLSDIPLTPGQRKLLGLDPLDPNLALSKPGTPTPAGSSAQGSTYITPPRYARTPTPLSGSPAGAGGSPRSLHSNSNSPLSAKGGGIGSSGSGTKNKTGAQDFLLLRSNSTSNINNSNSAFSPSNASPLLQKAMDGSRRGSYGSPLGANSASTSVLLGGSNGSGGKSIWEGSTLGSGGPGTPSPIGVGAGKVAGVPSRAPPTVALNNKWLYDRGRRSSGGSFS